MRPKPAGETSADCFGYFTRTEKLIFPHPPSEFWRLGVAAPSPCDSEKWLTSPPFLLSSVLSLGGRDTGTLGALGPRGSGPGRGAAQSGTLRSGESAAPSPRLLFAPADRHCSSAAPALAPVVGAAAEAPGSRFRLVALPAAPGGLWLR